MSSPFQGHDAVLVGVGRALETTEELDSVKMPCRELGVYEETLARLAARQDGARPQLVCSILSRRRSGWMGLVGMLRCGPDASHPSADDRRSEDQDRSRASIRRMASRNGA